MVHGADVDVRAITKRFGAVVAVEAVSFTVRAGEFFSLLGPSGCGKTTTLRVIGGFEGVDEGDILIGGRSMGRLPPNRRETNMVFQRLALFPHYSVFDNVAFGLRMRRLPGAEVLRRVAEALERVELGSLGARRIGELSGGQQQRVALARALVLNPDILLLDEPLSNLDAKIRIQVRAEIRKLQKELGITTVYVTHDQEEALSLSDRVAVMRDGRVLQVAPPKELYERPAGRFVADFVGTNNFLPGTCRDTAAGRVAETVIGAVRGAPNPRVGPGDRCVVAVRPENIALGAGSENTFEGRVVLASYLGSTLRYDVEVREGVVLKVDVGDPWHHEVLAMGAAVRVTFPASAALTLPDE
jgi:ABC-type Fe3+/spermidine/putrescine transport system ATPase subunit